MSEKPPVRSTEFSENDEPSEYREPYTPQHQESTSTLLEQGGYNAYGSFTGFNTPAAGFMGFSDNSLFTGFSSHEHSPISNVYNPNPYFNPQETMSGSHQLLQQYFL